MKHIELFQNYPSNPFPNNTTISKDFYEELEHCIREMKKIIDISEAFLKAKSFHENNIEIYNKERNLEQIHLNFNYLLVYLNLFKFDESNVQQKFLAQIYLLKLFLYSKEKFRKLREKFPTFFYFGIDEENRFLEAIRIIAKEKKYNLYPSKMGNLFLRYIRYYIFKINKYIFKNTDKASWKFSFNVK